MNPDSSLTQTLGVFVLSGVVILTGTNLNVQESLAYSYVGLHSQAAPTFLLPAAATKSTTPAPVSGIEAIEYARSDSRWHNYVYKRIEELRSRQYDFTGLQYPTDFVIDRAWSLATILFRTNTPTPSVLPTEGGEVLFVWHKAGWELEIDVGPEGIEVWAHHRQAGTVFSGSFAEQQLTVSGLLDFLARR